MVYDAIGRTVLENTNYTPAEQIQVSNLSSGIYLVRIYSGIKTYSTKMVYVDK